MEPMRRVFSFLLTAVLTLTACQSGEADPVIETVPAPQGQRYQDILLQPYDDLTALGLDDAATNAIFAAGTFSPEDIVTFSFDRSVFEGSEDIQAQVLEAGKNPGLGVRSLHEQGITGQGVNVAIIDQKLLTDHPEYAAAIAAYYDSGTDPTWDCGSMHGPAVVSLLAGKTCGVAPGAKVYFAGNPAYSDASYYIDSLNWIIAQNQALPEGEKIRVVSVSAAPSDWKNGEMWEEAVAAAQAEGILVLDCRENTDTGFVHACYYDPKNPEDVTACQPGFPDDPARISNVFWNDPLLAPASYRTSARLYRDGDYYYGYDGTGGRSWALPYVAGVLALGWQVNPQLEADEMKVLLFQSCYIDQWGRHYIDPCAFIELVQETV